MAGAAFLIAAVTTLARLAGFGRTVAFSQTVGDTCLGTAYVTANQLPTVIFEIVIGGALSGMVVPVLAGAVSRAAPGAEPVESGQGSEVAECTRRAAHDHVRHTASALVTWVVIVAVPLSVALAATAAPAMTLMLGAAGGCDTAAVLDQAVRFVWMFAPQILCYGLAAVLYGILQAHRRFLAPALAPLVSSVVVIASYVAFVPLGAEQRNDVARLPLPAELVLGLGTTAGVLALVITAAVPAARLGLGLRPRLTFPPGVGARVRALAVAALLPLASMQFSMLVALALANRGGGLGAGVLYSYAWSLFTVPYGVVAIPIATSAFTALSVRHSERDPRGYRAVLAMSARACLLATAALATALAAAAMPIADVFARTNPLPLQRALLTYAPGVVAFGLVALLSRALYASHHGRAAALSQVSGWLVVMAAEVALVAAVPADWAVAALGAGTTIGLAVGMALLFAAVVSAHGRGAFTGVGRAALAAALGSALGYGVGASVATAVPTDGLWSNAGAAALGAVPALLVFGAVALVIDGRALRAVLSRKPAASSPETPDS
ncbi:hypothetical protein GCM10022402_04630 [Salinactinospora qingdaonensis]|uniref:Peptidoglycan lipid II flippase n=1 Tax=Salinactinospora qingdaonensis TaxID=702744 RepID=A0ABP7EXN3_9ACTN